MDPFTIPPKGEVEIECEATPVEAGLFNCPMYITFYDGDYRDLKLSITGNWTVPRKLDDVAATH
jgi:hypothetical protein